MKLKSNQLMIFKKSDVFYLFILFAYILHHNKKNDFRLK